jgi:DNA-binding NarL/FixJ family response regulator
VFARLGSPNLGNKVEYQHVLSSRELEILKMLAPGKNNREIAQMLYLTEGTVKNYFSHILCQLGLRDRTQAALWAQQNLL